MTDEQLRLAHLAACVAAALSAVPSPSPQPRVESHSEALVSSHEGRPTVAEQKRRPVYP